MTEPEATYLTSERLTPVVAVLSAKVSSSRKWRCFAVACCRQAWHLMPAAARPFVEVVERLLDGKATEAERAAVLRGGTTIQGRLVAAAVDTASPSDKIRNAVVDPGRWELGLIPRSILEELDHVEGKASRTTAAQHLSAAARDIFGNPFRPTPKVDAAWLAWDAGTVRRLAQGVSDDQAFDRLPILADALEEAGCANEGLLGHLRGPGPHVRGCWAVDLLLGRA